MESQAKGDEVNLPEKVTGNHVKYTEVSNNPNKDIEEGSNRGVELNELIKKNNIILFIKTTCPFCFELKRTLVSKGVIFKIIECDKTNSDLEYYKLHLKKISGIETFPQLFVDDKFIGGCDRVKTLDFQGKLDNIIAYYVTNNIPKEEPSDRIGTEFYKRFGSFFYDKFSSLFYDRFSSLFYFPEIVNGNTARISGVIGMIISVLIVAFFNNPTTPWVTLAFAIDYVLRFIWGGQYSVVTMVATVLTCRLEPKWIPGPSNHFAIFCGLNTNIAGAGFYLGGVPLYGAISYAVLAFCCCLEGIFDFCIFSWIFDLCIYFGIIPKIVYSPYFNFRNFRVWAYEYTNAKEDCHPVGPKEHVMLPDQLEPTPADLIRPLRLETEVKLRLFHPIKYCRIDFFSIPMTIAALAYTWMEVGISPQTGWNTYVQYQTLFIVSVIIGLSFLCLYLLRCFYGFSKCWKEWNHPVSGNMFSTMTITCVLWGIMFLPQTSSGGGALIWIGSITQLFITIYRMQSLVYDRLPEEYMNPTLMATPLANFICSLAFSIYEEKGYMRNLYEMNYVSMSRLWFGIAVFYAIVMFIISFRAQIAYHNSDNCNRPYLFIWLATASIVGPAYYAVSDSIIETDDVSKGVFYQSMWCIALQFFVVLSWGWIRNFFGYEKDVSMWMYPFAYSIFALNTVQYYTFVGGNLFKVLSIITVSLACTSTAVCGLHFLLSIADMSLFKPRPKWNPLNFLKMNHEVFRFAFPRVEIILNGCTIKNIVSVERALVEVETLLSLLNEHSKHEDEVIYPAIRRYMPKLQMNILDEHAEGYKQIHELDDLITRFRINTVNESISGPILDEIRIKFKVLSEHFILHFRAEEGTMSVAAQKYLSIEQICELVKKAYDLTHMDEWRRILPFVVKNLPNPVWKVRYIKTLVWTIPYRAQEIGLALYHGCDCITWQFLIQEMPELIPRGLSDYKRIY